MPVAVAWTIASTHSHLHCYYYRNVQIYVCQKGWGANRNKIKWKMLRKIHKNYNHNKDNINININRKEKLRINILIHSNTIPTICERAIRIWFGLLHTHSHTGTFIYIYWMCVCVSERVSECHLKECVCVCSNVWILHGQIPLKYHWLPYCFAGGKFRPLLLHIQHTHEPSISKCFSVWYSDFTFPIAFHAALCYFLNSLGAFSVNRT